MTSTRDKSNYFIQFDIVEFYPSISIKLLSKTLDWEQGLTEISPSEREIIMSAKGTLLYNKGQPWCKKNPPNFFDVTMGSYDGAETCELVGLYILSKLRPLGVNLGLYRDDGLGVSSKPRRQVENIKK